MQSATYKINRQSTRGLLRQRHAFRGKYGLRQSCILTPSLTLTYGVQFIK